MAKAGPEQTVEANRPNSADVDLNGSESYDPDGDQLTFTWRENGEIIAGPTTNPISEVILSLGSHTVELTVVDGNGGSDKDEVTIYVVDTTPPEISIILSPDILWPPNHKMVDITAAVVVSDICDPDVTFSLVSITNNEPDNSHGNGDKPNDIQGADYGTADINFQLRAERFGQGNGRIYEVTYYALDASGNPVSVKGIVAVPHNMAKRMAHFEEDEPLPGTFAVFQYYPNPFNPETAISFQIPRGSRVILKIYNTLGVELRRLVDTFYEAGYYSAKWDGRDNNGNLMPSGVYIYRVQAGDFIKGNQMLLLR